MGKNPGVSKPRGSLPRGSGLCFVQSKVPAGKHINIYIIYLLIDGAGFWFSRSFCAPERGHSHINEPIGYACFCVLLTTRPLTVNHDDLTATISRSVLLPRPLSRVYHFLVLGWLVATPPPLPSSSSAVTPGSHAPSPSTSTHSHKTAILIPVIRL